MVAEEPYGLPSDIYSLGVVFVEMFQGVMRFDRDKAALAYIQEVRGKMSDAKPLPALLRAMLHSDPTQRPTARAALDSDAFKKFKIDESQFQVVHKKRLRPEDDALGKKKAAKKGRDDFEKVYNAFEFSNPLTIQAARTYAEKTSIRPEYCMVLASRMYEEDLVAMSYACERWPSFHPEIYRVAELAIFSAMDYCLYI